MVNDDMCDMYAYWDSYVDHDEFPDYDGWLTSLNLTQLLNVYTTIELLRAGEDV